MSLSGSTSLRVLFTRSTMASAVLWFCMPLLATLCPLQDYPLWVNKNPTIGEPLLFSLHRAEEAAAAMSWKYTLTVGTRKQRLTPMRLNGDSRFIVISMPVLQAGKKYKLSAVPPNRCRLLCGKTISGKIHTVEFEFSPAPENENTPSDLVFSGVQQQTLWFSLTAKGRPVLLRIDRQDANGNKTTVYNLIPEITIPITPGLRYPLSNRGCEALGYELEAGDSYSISLYAARHGKYEPLSGWAFAIPMPRVWPAGENAEFERQYAATTSESKKCDQLGSAPDVEARKRCKEVYETAIGLQRKHDERDGKYFEYGADKLNVQPISRELLPLVELH